MLKNIKYYDKFKYNVNRIVQKVKKKVFRKKISI